MEATNIKKFEKLDLLEEKISRTVERMTELNRRYEALQKKNKELVAAMDRLKNDNDDLSRKIEEMKSAKQNGALEEKKILSKIDRMLEKFGELQI